MAHDATVQPCCAASRSKQTFSSTWQTHTVVTYGCTNEHSGGIQKRWRIVPLTPQQFTTMPLALRFTTTNSCSSPFESMFCARVHGSTTSACNCTASCASAQHSMFRCAGSCDTVRLKAQCLSLINKGGAFAIFCRAHVAQHATCCCLQRIRGAASVLCTGYFLALTPTAKTLRCLEQLSHRQAVTEEGCSAAPIAMQPSSHMRLVHAVRTVPIASLDASHRNSHLKAAVELVWSRERIGAVSSSAVIVRPCGWGPAKVRSDVLACLRPMPARAVGARPRWPLRSAMRWSFCT